ncbi:unnamed protein product, partial [Brugia timori]|uniref:Phospholip_A2_4 domain-containing protein n=1 Tax=Brugia timori TaxID=42155 RepID=A0A0R3R4Y6_9BILA
MNDTWEADLLILDKYSTQNKGFKYLLNVIDQFSKYVWSEPLKKKTGKSVAETFEIRQNFKWYDILQELLEEYNTKDIHRTIGMTPSQVNKDNVRDILIRMNNVKQCLRKFPRSKGRQTHFIVQPTVKIIKNTLERFPRPKTGSGIMNSVIDKLPIELHWPGMEFNGPGTNVDLKLLQGVKPVNKLDEAAMHHDIAYARYSDLNKRHEADEKLEYAAWDRVKANDSDMGEKIAAWVTTNAMKVKRALGA